jgi:hypothetical protein
MSLKQPSDNADAASVGISADRAYSDGTRSSESGGIVLGWLWKVVAALVIVVVVGYDSVAIAYNSVATSDAARSVARAASDARLIDRSTKAQAIAAAEETAHAKGVILDPKDVVFGSNGSIQVTVSRSVDTLVAHWFGPLEEWATAVEVYNTKPVP